MATPYQLPSSFLGGMQGASNALSAGKLPQSVQSPLLKQILPTPKPAPVDPNKSPEVFKKRFIEKHGDGVAEDGRNYSQIPAPEIVAKVIRKYGDGNTTDGIPYREFLPRPASPNDSLEYRLKQIESLSQAPKSQFYTTGGVRGQTAGEKQFADKATSVQKEGEIMKTVKAPFRGLESVGQNLAFGTAGVAADTVDMFGGNQLAEKIRKATEQEQFKSGVLSGNKGLIGGLQSGELSSVVETLSSGVGYLATAAKIPLYLMALTQGGNMSLEGEQQGQGTFGDKLTAYGTGAISSAIDRMSAKSVIGGMMRAGIKKETATNFVQKMNNYLKGLKPSDFEAGTEVIQQVIENIGRSTMGVDYDKGIQQYFEAGLLGKILGKIGDKGFSESEVTTLPPAPPTTPRPIGKNLEVIQTIKTGITGNKLLKQAKGRGFDPELDVATYEELKPTITNDGKVNTDVAQENIQNFIEPYQEKLDNAIAQEGEFIPAEAFRNEILKELESEKSNIRTYKGWVSAANDAVDTAVENFGDENGNIPLSEVNNIKKKLGQNNNYTDPNITLDKTIARAAKQIVENYTKSADVKSLNNDLARWYTTRDYLQILGSGTKTVKGGRLGNSAARLSGIIIGSQLGPIAGMIGGEVAAKLQSEMMKGALKNTNTGMPEIESFNNIKLPSRQTSEDTKANKTTLLPPVLESEGTRKTKVVLPKKESSGEKVNSPIIPKSQPKAKLRTNEDALKKAVKTKKVDSELESLQKTQESLPGVSEVVVPDDYMPTDGLPTGTEFEAPIISSISKTKGKLPSPEIKRPQIRGFDLSTRSSMLESLKEQGMFTDSFFVVKDKNVSNKLFEYAEKKAIKKGNPISGTKVDIKALVERAENGADTILTPKEYMKLGKENGVYLRMDIGNGNQVAVNASYADIFFKNFDDVTFKGNNELSPVVVLSKGEPVGVIMPIKDVYNLKDKIGDFSMQNKTPQVEGKTVEKIKAMQLEQEDMIRKGESISEDFRNKWNDLQSQYKKEFIDSRIASERKKVDSAIRDIETKIKENPSRTDWGKKQIQMEEEGFNRLKKGDYFEKKYQEHISKIREEAKKSSLLKSVKNKPSLPLSSKSEVKYSKPIEDNLVKEAKKYKSAEEFVKAQKGTEIFHGTKKSTPDISKKEFQLDNKDRPTPGISFSVDKKRASDYGDNIIEAKIKPEAKIIKLDDAIKKGEITQLDWNIRSSEDEAIKWAKENGYDGIDISDAKSDWYKEEKEIRIFNKEAIYTKQQLIDIFNKSKS